MKNALKPFGGGAIALLVGGCAVFFPETPNPDPTVAEGVVFEARVSAWSASVKGHVSIRDAFGTDSEGQNPTRGTLSLDRDLDMEKADRRPLELDVRCLIVGDNGYLEGPRIRIRRGEWKGDIILDEDEDLGAVDVPKGSRVESNLLYEFYGGGLCRPWKLSEGLEGAMTAGVALTRGLMRIDFPQGRERTVVGAAILWVDLEARYEPWPWISFEIETGLAGITSGATVDAGGHVEVKCAGLQVELGYQAQTIMPESGEGRLSFRGLRFAIGVEF